MRTRILAAIAIVTLFGSLQPVRATTIHSLGFAQDDALISPDATAGATYCRSTGGRVEVRTPEYGTNGSNPLVLSGKAVFCQYTAKDGSRIYVLASTLNAVKPTLAALAYYAKVPISKSCGSGGADPAPCYCTQLGGTDQFGGINPEGGAWVLQGSVDVDLETCIFPDLSSIDSWGLTYHADGIIRGIDLTKVLRYHKK